MSEEKKTINDYVEAILDSSFHRIMGKALDIMRTSEMKDRALMQASRSLKDYVNELELCIVKDLKEKGIIK